MILAVESATAGVTSVDNPTSGEMCAVCHELLPKDSWHLCNGCAQTVHGVVICPKRDEMFVVDEIIYCNKACYDRANAAVASTQSHPLQRTRAATATTHHNYTANYRAQHKNVPIQIGSSSTNTAGQTLYDVVWFDGVAQSSTKEKRSFFNRHPSYLTLFTAWEQSQSQSN
jgi:hypothetical protein